MEHITFARGFCEQSIKSVMTKRLYCPTSEDDQLPLIKPKLHFWSDPESITAAEKYALLVANAQSKAAFVVTLTSSRQTFSLLEGKIVQPGGSKAHTENGRIIRFENPISTYNDIQTDKVSIALNLLSDEELIALFCKIGITNNGDTFSYQTYQDLLKAYSSSV